MIEQVSDNYITLSFYPCGNGHSPQPARIPRYARINALKWTVDQAIEAFQRSGFVLRDPLDDGTYVPPPVRLSIHRTASPHPLTSGTSHGTCTLKTFCYSRRRRGSSTPPNILMAASSSKIRLRVSRPSCLLHQHTRGALS